MMISNRTIVSIDLTFRKLIQKQNYERYVLAILNKSKIIFKGREFTRIEDQANGESDFVDNYGQCYEAKLLFNKKQGALVGEPKNDINNWLQEMVKEMVEFGEVINQRNLSLVEKTKLYSITKDRLSSVKPDENAIFFIPFPIVDESKGSIFLQFATDFLQAVYNRLVENNLVGERRIYFIYPDGNPYEYVLRDDQRTREYIECIELEDFITYRNRVFV